MESLRIYADLALPPDALELLRAGTAGHTLVFPAKPIASVLAKGEPDPQFATIDVAFGQPDTAAIADAPKLRWVHVSSAGITRYDTPEFRALAEKRGLPVSNSSGVYDEACAVHALAFMLAHARKIPLGLRTRITSSDPKWQALRDASGTLRDESVLLLGFGAIAKRLAELLRPFGVKPVAFRRQPRGDEGMPVVTEANLPTALAEADHVVNILPESPATRRFFDAARFAQLKPGAAFYNIGRGATVDQDALLAALRSGHVGAAWLDVTDPEPLPDSHPLWAEPNCFITPHVAGGHTGEACTLVRHFLRNLERFTRGEALVDRVM
jgi:phosphoglycerate dehydrogenase-like enzyme